MPLIGHGYIVAAAFFESTGHEGNGLLKLGGSLTLAVIGYRHNFDTVQQSTV
jgi:hypothetical protein